MRSASPIFLSLLLFATTGAMAQRICDAKAYGAKADGFTNDAAAIQKAIDACSRAGGGTVLLAASPIFVTGPLILRSDITLDIAQGTTLAASTDHDDFASITEFREPGLQPLLSSDNARNIVIDGGGTIDGRGESWWSHREPGYLRPRLIVFSHSRHIRMENVTVENSPMWQIVPYYSDDLTFRNMKILAPNRISHNTDGIDPFSSGHVTIDHVLIDTGDDDVAIKSGQPGSPGPDAPSHDILIEDCTFLHGHGLSIGSEVAGGVRNVLAERIRFEGTGTGVRIKSNRDRGNDISHLVYRDLTMQDVETPILISEFYPKVPATIEPERVTRLTPHFHNITIENLQATGARQDAVIIGLPESPIQKLRLDDVHISGTKGAKLAYADISGKDFAMKASKGKSLEIGAGVHKKLRQSAVRDSFDRE